MAADVDIAIVGGGFFGCALALFLRSVSDRVTVFEAEAGLFERASQTNQARVHAGFHYPRSFVTAMRSHTLQRRFRDDFGPAVVDDFDMLYAIARRRSKVSAARFLRMFENMGAPIQRASAAHHALFSGDLIEDVFLCKEAAFDWRRLRDIFADRLDAAKVTVRYNATVDAIRTDGDSAVIHLADGSEAVANCVFNVTYANLNAILDGAGLARLPIKHELAEIALIEPPRELAGLGVTVMDGPFFSVMPYPSQDLYSMTHVRYTPHLAWAQDHDGRGKAGADASRWRHMKLDASRYMPCLAGTGYVRSLFDIKTVLTKNERNDARPIYVARHQSSPAIYSVLGGKLDNVYDLLDALAAHDPRWRSADARYLLRR